MAHTLHFLGQLKCYTKTTLPKDKHRNVIVANMGAAESKDGEQRSTLARWVDPNGLLIEPTSWWQSGTLELAAAEISITQETHPPPTQQQEALALDLGVPQIEPAEEKDEQPKCHKRSTSLIDDSMELIAPPSIARWLAVTPPESGEQLFELRRSQSTAESSVTASLHRRARSLTFAAIPDVSDIVRPRV